jgi:hypothetical protein
MLAHLVGSVLRIKVLPEPFEPAHAFLLRSRSSADLTREAALSTRSLYEEQEAAGDA